MLIRCAGEERGRDGEAKSPCSFQVQYEIVLRRQLNGYLAGSRRRQLSSGRIRGGVALTNGPLAHILRNRLYLGETNHKGASYPGEHEPIIAPALFAAVQEKLSANLNGARMRRTASGALLVGRIFDDRGHRMTPSTAKKGSVRYRYYISSVLLQGRSSGAGPIARVSAADVEMIVLYALRSAYPDDPELSERALIEARVERVVLRPGSILVEPRPETASPIEIAWSPRTQGGRREILMANGSDGHDRGIKPEARTVLLRSIALGRRWAQEILSGATLNEIAACEGCTIRHVENTIPLAFLAPDIIRAVVDARLPRGTNVRSIADPALEWSRQWTSMGISRPAP